MRGWLVAWLGCIPIPCVLIIIIVNIIMIIIITLINILIIIGLILIIISFHHQYPDHCHHCYAMLTCESVSWKATRALFSALDQTNGGQQVGQGQVEDDSATIRAWRRLRQKIKHQLLLLLLLHLRLT